MQEGSYHFSCDYDPTTTASVTFTGANAIMLHSFASWNELGFTVTLDNATVGSYNSSDVYWLHAPQLLYFAGGLDPTQEHQLTVSNYVAGQSPPPGVIWCLAVDALVLIMDDPAYTTLVANSTNNGTNGLVGANNGPTPFGAGDIAAVVLGSLCLALLGIITWLLARQKRRVYIQKPRNDVHLKENQNIIPKPWTQDSDVGIAPTPILSTGPSAIENTQLAKTRPSRHAQSPVREATSPISTEGEVARAGSSPSGQPTPRRGAASPLPNRDLVDGLSRLLNRRLHEEYLERDGVNDPPDYAPEPGEDPVGAIRSR